MKYKEEQIAIKMNLKEQKENRILIINHHSANKGDMAIFLTMIDVLKRYIPNAELSVLSDWPEETLRQPAVIYHNVKVIEWLLTFRRRRENEPRIMIVFHNLLWTLQSLIWAIFKKWKNVANVFACSRIKNIMEKYADADIVITCGGGPLSNIYNLTFFLYWYPMFLGIILNKPIMMYAQSVGPFTNKVLDPVYKLLTRFVLNRASLITLREDISKKQLQDLGVNGPPIYVTADAAFPLQPDINQAKVAVHKEEIIKDKKKPLVGITLLRWNYLGSSNPELKHEKYKKVMAQVADYLVTHLNAKVVFIPMDVLSIPSSDGPLNLEICNMMEHKDAASVISGEYTPEVLKGIMGEMDMMVGTRLHSIIFSTTMGVPGVCIRYDPKTDGIMSMLGLKGYICNINDITMEDLVTKINELWSSKEEVKKRLGNRVNILQERSLLNAKFAAELLKFAKSHKGEKFSLDLTREEIALLEAI